MVFFKIYIWIKDVNVTLFHLFQFSRNKWVVEFTLISDIGFLTNLNNIPSIFFCFFFQVFDSLSRFFEPLYSPDSIRIIGFFIAFEFVPFALFLLYRFGLLCLFHFFDLVFCFLEFWSYKVFFQVMLNKALLIDVIHHV